MRPLPGPFRSSVNALPETTLPQKRIYFLRLCDKATSLDTPHRLMYLTGVFRYANKSWIATACAVLLGLFVIQTVVAQAEHAGLITCLSDAAQKDGTAEKSSRPMIPCGHCHCPQVGEFTLGSLACVLVLPNGNQNFSLGNEVCPDGPVRSIDYPPQLA